LSESFIDKTNGKVMRRRVSRRNILAASGAVGLGAAGLALVGCGDDDDDSASVAQTGGGDAAEQTSTAQTSTAQTPSEQTSTAQTPAEQTATAQTSTDDGYADSTPETVPPKSSKDIAVLAIAATPIAVDPDFGHGSPATWESWMNLLDQTIKFGWRDYPFDVGSVNNVEYISFENDDLLPWMQESWELSEDQSSLVINIRPGVLSSTGNELTAGDFAYRIDRAFALGAIGAFFTNTITLDPNNPYEILGDHQIKINSTGPNGLLVPIWANSAWQVVDATDALANATDDDEWSVEWMAQNAIGFGGIAVETFGTGERVSFTANPNYFRGEPPIKTIVYEEVPQASNRLAAVERGEADAAYGLPGELFLQAQEEAIQNPIAVKGNLIFFGFMNALHEPFQDPRTRQALNWAAPRQEILDIAFGSLGVPWTTVMTSIFPGANEGIVPWGADPNFAEAQQLLDAAGQGDGFDVTLDYDTSVAQYERMGVLMQDAYSNVGVNVSLNPQPNGPYAAEATGKEKTFGLWQDAYIQPDPIYFLNLGYDAGLGGINNYGQVDDPELNDLIDQAKRMTVFQDRVDIATPIQERVVDLSPYIWLVEPFYTNVLNENLRGFRWHTTQETYWSDMYFV